jgi:SAM-dependent methyltransferase
MTTLDPGGNGAAPAATRGADPAPRQVLAREPAPILVFGAPRSGTTYVQRVLDLHPQLFLSHETRVFAWLHAAIEVLPDSDQYVVTERARFVAHLRTELPNVLRDFYARLSPDTRYWGDKNPHYADPANLGCLTLVAELFPGAKFVNIVRDGRDVVASLLRRTHTDGRPWADFEAAHRTWVTHLEIGRGFGRRQPSGAYLEIRYEDFVRDDVGQARQLCDFLGIEMSPAIEEFCAAQATERTPLSSPTRARIGEPGSSDWATLLSPADRRRSLDLLGPHLVHLGYETPESIEAQRAALARELQPVRATGAAAGEVAEAPSAPLRRLNWGCGHVGEPGWINSDVKEGPGIDISTDIRDGLPIDPASLDYIVSIHALPMIQFDDLVPVLGELRRVLKPGGVLRLGLPDLDAGIRAYLAGDRSYFAVPDHDAESLGGKFALHLLWYGHSVAMFTAEFACELLTKSGFAPVRRCGFRESPSGLAGITDLDNREDESFFVEAVKPIR